MTPPVKWFIDKEDESVVLCTSNSNTPGSVERQGIVRDIKSGLAKGRPVLKVSFHDGKARGFSLESFDWSRSLLSKLLHSKQASTVEKFVEVWKTDIQRDNCSTQPSGGLSRRTQHSTHRDRTTPSRKRTAADAQLDQNSSPPPSLCPVHIISDTQPPKADSDCTQLDEAIEKAFVGYFTLPVTCLVEPGPSRLLRPVDPIFVDTLKTHMKRNPSRDVTPIVGLVQLPEGESFHQEQKETYLYETLGGNNSRVAMQQLLEEDDLGIRTRLVSVYFGLSDNQALRLATKHNLATSIHHDMTTSDKVHLCRSLRYRMANADLSRDQVPSVNVMDWRSKCADILMEKVRSLDDSSTYYLSSLPPDAYALLEKVFSMFAEGNIKGQSCPRGSLGKKLDLKGCNFKPMRGLDASTIKSLLERLTKQELSISEMTKKCRKMKTLRELQKAFVEETGVKAWEEAAMKFPDYANAEALDQFIEENPKKATTSNRFKAFCRGALHSLEANAVVVSPVEGSFQHERVTAFVLPNLSISYFSITSLCSLTKTPFKGLTLTLLHMQDIKTNEGETLEAIVRSVRSINTMAGTRSFAVAVVCDLEHHPQVIHALGSEVVETCYIYSKNSKNNRRLTGSMDILCVALFGEAEVESRERLFNNKSTVEVKDDTGKLVSSHPDWDECTYAEIFSVFSQEDDYIYLPRIVSVEGVLASLKTGRNCISLGSTALKLYAQRSIMARLVEEEEESDERLVEEERDEMEHDDN